MISKMCLFSMTIMENYTYEEICGLSMILVLKILEQLSPGNKVNKYVKDIVKRLNLERATLKPKL